MGGSVSVKLFWARVLARYSLKMIARASTWVVGLGLLLAPEGTHGERLFSLDARCVRCTGVTLPVELHDEITDTDKTVNLYGSVFFNNDLTNKAGSTYFYQNTPTKEWIGSNGEFLYKWSGDNLQVNNSILSFQIINYGARSDGQGSMTTVGWANLTLPASSDLTSFDETVYGSAASFGEEISVDVFSWTDSSAHGTCDIQVQLRASMCEEGEYVHSSKGPCQGCPAGSRCNGRSSSLCSPGTYSFSGASRCERCNAGYTCPNSGSQNPNAGQCEPGTYSNAGDSVCQDCYKGYYGAGIMPAINLLCDGDCSPGFYCAAGSTNSTSTKCPPGSWSAAGASECSECRAGFFGAGIKNATTDECDGSCKPGYYCEQGSTSGEQAQCPPGHFSAAGSWECNECSKGFFGSGVLPAGTHECDGPCSPGFFCEPGSQSAEHKQCPAGHFSVAGSSECSKCKAGFFGAGVLPASTEACDGPCSSGHYCEEGSTSSKQHQCPENYWSLLGSNECSKCKEGYYGVAGGEYADETCAGLPPSKGLPGEVAGVVFGLLSILFGAIVWYARRRMRKVHEKEDQVKTREAAVLKREEELQNKLRDIQQKERAVSLEVDSLNTEKSRVEKEAALAAEELALSLKAELEQIDPEAAEWFDLLDGENKSEILRELAGTVNALREKYGSKLPPEQLDDDPDIANALKGGEIGFLQEPPVRKPGLAIDSHAQGAIDKLRSFAADINQNKDQYLHFIEELVASGSLTEIAGSESEMLKQEYDKALWQLKSSLHAKRRNQLEKINERRKRRLELMVQDAELAKDAAAAGATEADAEEEAGGEGEAAESASQLIQQIEQMVDSAGTEQRRQHDEIKQRLGERNPAQTHNLRRPRPAAASIQDAQVDEALVKAIQDDLEEVFNAQIKKMQSENPTKEQLDGAMQRLRSEMDKRKAEQLERIAKRRKHVIEQRSQNLEKRQEERAKLEAKQEELDRKMNNISEKIKNADEEVKALKNEHEAATKQLKATMEEKKRRQRERLEKRKKQAMQKNNNAGNGKIAPDPKAASQARLPDKT